MLNVGLVHVLHLSHVCVGVSAVSAIVCSMETHLAVSEDSAASCSTNSPEQATHQSNQSHRCTGECTIDLSTTAYLTPHNAQRVPSLAGQIKSRRPTLMYQTLSQQGHRMIWHTQHV